MQISIHTTEDTVAKQLKSELVGYCNRNGLGFKKGCSKETMVSIVWPHVRAAQEAMVAEKENAEAAANAAQEEALVKDAANDLSQAIIKGLVKNLQKDIEQNSKTIKAFQERVMSSGVEDAISWKAEEALTAEAANNHIVPFCTFFGKTDKYTVDQKLELVEQSYERLLNECLNDFEHKANSTCAFSNVCKSPKFAAKQKWVKTLRAMSTAIKKAIACNNADEAEMIVQTFYVW